MSAVADAFKSAGKFILTDHAKERIRQRIGITGNEAQVAWVNELITKSDDSYKQGNKKVYCTERFEVVCDGIRVITIKPVDNVRNYADSIGGVVSKEIRKLLTPQERLLRKAEIKVVELTLNYLKARNPRTKALINERLVEATDEKQRIHDEVFAIKKAAKQFGVEV